MPFPTHPDHGVSEQVIETVNIQQSMHKTAVADVDLGGFDQTLFHIGVERRQAAQQQQINQQVEIAGHGIAAHIQVAGQPGGIEQGALLMGQHDPAPTQGSRRHTRAEQGNIALKISGNKLMAPANTVRIRGGIAYTSLQSYSTALRLQG